MFFLYCVPAIPWKNKNVSHIQITKSFLGSYIKFNRKKLIWQSGKPKIVLLYLEVKTKLHVLQFWTFKLKLEKLAEHKYSDGNWCI